MIFLYILVSSWKAFGLIFASILRSKFHQKMHSKFHRFLDRFWEAFWASLASHLAPKIAPKIDPGRPMSTESPLERAQEAQDPQKSPKMEPKVSPRPSKSTLWTRPGFQNGASELPTWNPKAPDFPKWILAQGIPNDPKINQTSSQTNAKFKTKLDPIWNQPGTKFWIH